MSWSDERKAVFCIAVCFFIVGVPVADDFTLWETGGMYFCVPYEKGTIETDFNAWHEDGEPGFSLFSAYAFSDRFTVKMDLPFDFESSPAFKSTKITGLYGILTKTGDLTISGDFNLDCNWSEADRAITPILGVNFGKRWGAAALLTRVSGGTSIWNDSIGTNYTPVAEIEASPFFYTGEIGMIGAPVMVEYDASGDEGSRVSVNLALDWELYLPGGISLWVVPRYEVAGESGFSIWTGVAWMLMPE